jgi:hypothetical protein
VTGTLTTNPANGVSITNGVLKVISSAPGAGNTCDPSKPTPTPTLREWITQVQSVNSTYYATEQEFEIAPLATAEETFLTTACADFKEYYSGAGICTCPKSPTP